jgi:hypothetical protein
LGSPQQHIRRASGALSAGSGSAYPGIFPRAIKHLYPPKKPACGTGVTACMYAGGEVRWEVAEQRVGEAGHKFTK